MFELTAIGNAIVDIIIKIEESDLKEFPYTKGTMNLVSEEQQKEILSRFSNLEFHKISGGAAANSLVVASQLGVKSALVACYSNDIYGQHYHADFKDLGIALPVQAIPNKLSGTSVILVTPDGERTMQTCLGVSADIAPEHITEDLINKTEVILIEGYLLTSETGWACVQKAVSLAKACNKKIAATLSAPFIIEFFRDKLDYLINNSDICFANSKEAELYTGLAEPESAILDLNQKVSHVIVTLNKAGALIAQNGIVTKVNTQEVRPVDSTGAGDAFCGAYLAQTIKGYSPEIAGKLACKIAGAVVQQYGARLDSKILENYATI